MRLMFRGVLVALLLAELAGIAWLVIDPSPSAPTESIVEVSGWLSAQGVSGRLSDTAVVEYALNVLLFVPLGLLCATLWRRVPLAVWMMIAILISGALELLQLQFLPERQANAKDFTANTVGMFLGAGPVTTVRLLLRGLRQMRRWHRSRRGTLVEPLMEAINDPRSEPVAEPLG